VDVAFYIQRASARWPIGWLDAQA